MISVLLIEDELPAQTYLSKVLADNFPEIVVVGKLDSVSTSIAWLQKNQNPDIIFLDIQLSDGLSFEIFDYVNPNSYIIFTTAYDEYALQAFELQSIDYLLKPIQVHKLHKSIQKYTSMVEGASLSLHNKKYLQESLYKNRFLISIGTKLLPITVEEISCFYIQEKFCFVLTTQGKSYPIDYSLDTLETLVNPNLFFRVNRQYLVHKQVISDVRKASKSKLYFILPYVSDSIWISTHKTVLFKEWFLQ